MLFNNNIVIVLTILASVRVQGVTISKDGSNPPASPCPDIFQYTKDGSGWFGTLTIPHATTTDGKVIVKVMISVPAVLPSKSSVGKLKVFDSKEDIYASITNEGPVRYKLIFPTQSALPHILKINQNANILCQGPPIYGLRTEIALEHTLTLINAPEKVTNTDNNLSHLYPLNNPYTDNPFLESVFKNMKPRDPSIPFIPPPVVEVNPFEEFDKICGRPAIISPLVLGGVDTKRGMYPWLAVIYRRTTSQLNYLCGGSLITDRHILTAAHCMKRPNTKLLDKGDLIIHLGRFNLLDWTENGAEITDVEEIHLHPDYGQKNFFFHSDIAILKLANVIVFNQYIRPICFKFDGAASTGETGYIVGWGQNSSLVSTKPKQVQMPIVSQEKCLRSNEAFYYFTSNTTYCAGSQDGSGPCNGDSGTGMYIKDQKAGRFFIRGLVSLSLQDPITRSCDLNNYVIFTDLNPFKSWIQITATK